MQLAWEGLGDLLLESCSACRAEAVLVAPFIKAATLRKLLSALPSTVPVTCLTRWRLEEIVAGVSDIDCWKIVSERENSKLRLLSNLHTKYFRFDDATYVGSANLTMTALGWSRAPNAEALVRFSNSVEQATTALEAKLFSNSVEVTQELFEQFELMLANMPVANRFKPELQSIEDLVVPLVELEEQGVWVPRFRSPEILFRIYSGSLDATSADARRDAIADLNYFDLPTALTEPEFRDLIRSRLSTAEVIVAIDRFLAERRRFGEMRNFLRDKFQLEDSTNAWQTLMRWLIYFLPDRYATETPAYSEIFGRKAI
ncbi:MAG: phospholipase D family protein [Rhodocyclaceae bacterium]|nr:phospholipase D family protein [Rhodocyclaceae bacterium]MCA3081288.1 phospholipase D family protein [Rhodocyclaceae bacterium]